MGWAGGVLWKMQAYDANPLALDRSWSTWTRAESQFCRGTDCMNTRQADTWREGGGNTRSSALPSGECNKWLSSCAPACSRVKCIKESRNGNYNQIRVWWLNNCAPGTGTSQTSDSPRHRPNGHPNWMCKYILRITGRQCRHAGIRSRWQWQQVPPPWPKQIAI